MTTAHIHTPGGVVTSQVVAIGPGPHLLAGNRNWSTGMCAMCDDMGVCCCVLLNPFYSCMLAKRLGENVCTPYCVGTVPLRMKTRYALGIRGDMCNDCATMYFCGSCATCQVARELNMVNWPQ